MAKPVITILGTHIKVADIRKSREFYESLGFEPVFGYGDDEFRESLPEGVGSAPERYKGISYKIGENAELEIAEGHIAVPDSRVFQEPILSPKISAMVKVESLVPLFSNPLVKITFPVRHYYWGTIEAAFRDPDGFVLVFIAPHSSEEFDNINEFTTVEVIEAGQ